MQLEVTEDELQTILGALHFSQKQFELRAEGEELLDVRQACRKLAAMNGDLRRRIKDRLLMDHVRGGSPRIAAAS